MTLYLIFLIFTQQASAKINKPNEYKNNQHQLIKMAGFAQALREIPQACHYVTTDMYTAASAANIYMAADSSLTHKVDKINLKDIKLLPESAKKEELMKHRNSLIYYKSLLNKQHLLAKSMRTGLNIAKSYALNRFAKQKSDVNSCTSELLTISQEASNNRFCGNECAKSIKKNREIIISREKSDFTALASRLKESNAKQMKSEIRYNFSKSCSKLGCIKALNRSSRACKIYRNQYYVNLVYCNKSQIGRNDKNSYKSNSNPEISKYKKKSADFIDNWIAHPRGRSMIYGIYTKYIDETISSINSIITDIDKQLEETTKMFHQLNLTTTKSELKKNDSNTLKRKISISRNRTQKCFFQKCMSHKKMWEMRKRDYRVIGDSAVSAGSLTNNISADILHKNSFDKEIIDKIDQLNNLDQTLITLAKRWQRRSDGVALSRESVPRLTTQEQEKSLFSNMLTKMVAFIYKDDKEEKKEIISPKSRAGHSDDEWYVISSIHKNKNLSIWNIISKRYFKVFANDL